MTSLFHIQQQTQFLKNTKKHAEKKKKHAHAHTNSTAMKTKLSADYITAN